MIVDNYKHNIESVGLEDSTYFSLQQENIPHIFRILRSSLYSDKILAVIREYSTNSADAHVVSNITKPIEITFPVQLDPYFKVRDFGLGLSDSEVKEVYISYGASSKRESNELIGQLGLGSKSAFAYTNSFTVTSWNVGMKRVYECYIDETDIGKITCVSETESDEEQGVEISIAVKNSDIYKFQETIKKFFVYFNPRPIFHNYESINSYLDSMNKPSILEGPSWSITNNRDCKLLMGNVAYNLDLYQIDYIKFLNTGLIIKAEIGSVSITASREGLEYNNKTKKFLISKMEEIINEIEEISNTRLQAAPTLWKARQIYKELYYTSCELRNLYPKEFIWSGIKVDRYSINLQNLKKTLPITIRSYYQTHKKLKYSHPNFLSLEDLPIIIYDTRLVLVKDVNTKINNYISANKPQNNSITLFKISTDEELASIKNHIELQGIPLVYLSDIEGKSPPSKSGTIRYNTKIFQCDGTHTIKSDLPWNPIKEIPDGKKPYIELDRFLPDWKDYPNKFYLCRTEDSVRVFYNILVQSFPGESIVLFGVRKTLGIEKLDDSWIPAHIYFKDTLLNVIKDKNILQNIDLNKELEKYPVDSFYISLARYYERIPGKLFKNTLQRIYEAKSIQIRNLTALRRILGLEINISKPNIDVHKNLKEIESKYPMLEIITRHTSIHSTIDEFVEYCEIMNRKRK